MSIEDVWFVRFGEYIGYWPGMALVLIAYVVGVTMACLYYKSWAKRTIYTIALTISVATLWTVLELVKLY